MYIYNCNIYIYSIYIPRSDAATTLFSNLWASEMCILSKCVCEISRVSIVDYIWCIFTTKTFPWWINHWWPIPVK